MSDSARPEWEALDQLEAVLKKVSEELASWRRRALKAEANRGLNGEESTADEETLDRIADLESENGDLRGRVKTAREKSNVLVTRLRFLEEQVAESESNE